MNRDGNEGIDCGNCIGACCRAGNVIPLSPAEAEQLNAAGSQAELLPKDQWQGNKPGRKRAFYKMIVDCGNLMPDNSCGDYDNRPRACSEFQAGGYVCQLMRLHHGVDIAPQELPVITAEEPSSQPDTLA